MGRCLVLALELWVGWPCCGDLLWAPLLQLTVRFWGCSLGEGSPPLHTETCAHVPRHAHTQTGTRVNICDTGQPAPVVVPSGVQEPLAELTPPLPLPGADSGARAPRRLGAEPPPRGTVLPTSSSPSGGALSFEPCQSGILGHEDCESCPRAGLGAGWGGTCWFLAG